MQVISADSHIDTHWLPFDLFTSNATPPMKDRMPYVADTPQGLKWVTHAGVSFGFAGGVGSTGKPYIKGSSHRADRMAEHGLYTPDSRKAHRLSDAQMRIEDQDTDGVTAEVLYGMLGASIWLRDPEAAWEMARIYNDWLVEFCAHSPNRLLGLSSIPTHDPKRAADEIRRVARQGGIKGLDVSGGEGRGMPLYHQDWADFWNAVDESGLPVRFHTGADERA
ncbi:MAG: amidohydrolase family protein [Betaproteobacteria bacterium]|nr:amidohydrolase family protein [Betaproteobacteria bacterium]